MTMKFTIIMQKLIMALVAVLFIGASLPAFAQQAGAQRSWMPSPPKAIGGKCDADPSWMRKWHMRALEHKRDETMHQGIRTRKFSLKNCIGCHAVKDKAGKYLTVKDERHFCRSCHDYAAVRIDCFDCHASRPGEKMDKAAKARGNPHLGNSQKSTAIIKKRGGAASSSTLNMDTALATLQKFTTGEGK